MPCSSPSRPTTTVAAAQPQSPPNGAQFSYESQPIKLPATGGASSDSATVTIAAVHRELFSQLRSSGYKLEGA